MFGKNKKKEEEIEEIKQNQEQVIMHTMDDDLNSEYKKNTNIAGERSEDTFSNIESESPFSKAISHNQKTPVNNPLNDNKVKHSASIENESKISSKPFRVQQNNVFSEKAEKPFANNAFSSNEKMEDSLQNLKKDNENANHSNFGQKSKTTIEDRLNKIKESSSEATIDYLEETANHNDGGATLKKVVYSVAVLALVGIIVAGGYYLWMNKNKIVSLFYTGEKISNEVQNDDNNVGGSVEEKLVNEFSEKSNFLVVNDLNKDSLMSAIRQTFDKMPENKLLEFVIVDKDNVRLLFPEFSNAMELSLDSKIMNNLEDEFSIFLYKKTDSNRRISLVVSISNKELLLSAISMNADTLIQEIKPLFLGELVSENKELGGFSTSIYNSISIRYNNLSENSDLSLDYAIINNNLMLATSKDSGRLIIDKVLKESNAEEIINNSTIDSDNIEVIFDDNSNIN